ncbi:MAG: RtcB family protein [Actinomycetota bacterium]
MRVIDGVPVWGEHDQNTIDQIQRSAADGRVAAAALMADGHLGYAMPIGGVVAYRDAISPNGVGFDISCGNKAALTDLRAEEIRDDMAKIMDTVFAKVAFGIGSESGRGIAHPLFDDPAWSINTELASKKQRFARQLGSVGSGNHYVDVFEDEHGRVWIGVHFGSRGLGHTICTGFMNLAKGSKWGERPHGESMQEAPTVINLGTSMGDDYWALMELAGRFAYAGRDLVVDQVCEIIGAHIEDEVHNHHNYAWRETHDGEDVIVVRKGATPAFPGQRGFVGGSMGDDAVIVEGTEPTEEQGRALASTVHGAGRVMSRRQAAGKLRWRKGPDGKRRREIVSPGAVDPKEMKAWVEKKGVELRGAGLDEAPQVYRRLNDVLDEHALTIKVLHTLKPMGVAMAGADVFDPYKD